MLVQSPVQQGMHPRTRPIIMTTFREWQIRRKPTSNPTADIAMLLSLPSVEAHNSAHSNSPSCWVDLTSFAEHCTSSIPDRKAKASRGIAAARLQFCSRCILASRKFRKVTHKHKQETTPPRFPISMASRLSGGTFNDPNALHHYIPAIPGTS